MRKYFITTLAVLFALNAQTTLLARELSKKASSMPSLNNLLPSDKWEVKDLMDKLSDSDFIALEKILLSPAQRAYNDLTKNITDQNKVQIFRANMEKVNKLASTDLNYANGVVDAYYKIYLEVLNNPSGSADFDLTPAEMEKEISRFVGNIVARFEKDDAFIKEKKNNPFLSFADIFSTIVKRDVDSLETYYSQHNIGHFLSVENPFKVIVKPSAKWNNSALHQKKLIQLAALRAMQAYLLFGKQDYILEIARFDFISLLINAKTDTLILLGDQELKIVRGAYKYVPFNPGQLVSRNDNFLNGISKIAQEKLSEEDNSISKIPSTPRVKRGEDYTPPKPSVYDSPYGAGSVR